MDLSEYQMKSVADFFFLFLVDRKTSVEYLRRDSLNPTPGASGLRIPACVYLLLYFSNPTCKSEKTPIHSCHLTPQESKALCQDWSGGM